LPKIELQNKLFYPITRNRDWFDWISDAETLGDDTYT